MIGGQGWQSVDGGIQKTFEFADYKYTSNFLMRYSDYCTKVGQKPQWQNVYNTVDITITNPYTEGQVTTREVELAKYLDMMQSVQVTDYTNIDRQLSFEQIVQIAELEVSSAMNDQNVKTSIEINDGANMLKLA